MSMPGPTPPRLCTMTELQSDADALVEYINASGAPLVITRRGRFVARIDGIEHLDMEEIAGLGIFTDADLAALETLHDGPDGADDDLDAD